MGSVGTGPTLISATPSAYARINRIAFAEKSIPFTLKNEVPWNHDTETPKFNPLEKLPILILEDGSSIYDSTLIQDWILHTYKGQGPDLMPNAEKGSYGDVVLARQIQVLAQGHMDAMALRFFEGARGEKGSEEYMARQDRKIKGALKAYDAYVKSAKGEYLVGNEFSIADIAVGCAVDWVDFFGLEKDWRGTYPDLAGWWEKLKQRPSFEETKPVMFEMKNRVV